MQRYTPQADVNKFHNTFAPDQGYDALYVKIERRASLIEEEYQEVLQALDYLDRTDEGATSSTIEEAKEELAKELADLLYVVYGTADELEIPLEFAFKAVHKSNMSKAESDGTVKRNEFGKILKPSTYTKPDLSFIHDNRFLPQST
jgi:predicted HAD superfamily Cof-like phosphohydrolase